MGEIQVPEIPGEVVEGEGSSRLQEEGMSAPGGNQERGQVVDGAKKVFTVRGEPVAAPRMTQGQVKLLRIPDYKLDKKALTVKARIKRYLQYKDMVGLVAKIEGKCRDAYEGAVALKINFVFEGNPFESHTGKPDLDNLVKAMKDGLKGIAYKDDKQVVFTEAGKEYGPEAKACVEVVFL